MLHRASRYGNTEIVKALIDSGAYVDHRNDVSYCMCTAWLCTCIHEYKITVLWENIAGHEIRIEKCLDMCHHKIKFVLICTKNDLILIEINVIT